MLCYVSFGIKKSASNVELLRFVMISLKIDITVQVLNHLAARNYIEDSSAASRLSVLNDYLKSTFLITDTSSILQSR